jgi:hypothetical protein
MSEQATQSWKPEQPMIVLRIAAPSPEQFIFAPMEVRAHILNHAGLVWGFWLINEMNKMVETQGYVYGPLNHGAGILLVSDVAAGLRELKDVLTRVSILPFSQFGFWDEREGFVRTWHPTSGGVEDLGFYVSAERLKQAEQDIRELSTFFEKHRPGGNQS